MEAGYLIGVLEDLPTVSVMVKEGRAVDHEAVGQEGDRFIAQPPVVQPLAIEVVYCGICTP